METLGERERKREKERDRGFYSLIYPRIVKSISDLGESLVAARELNTR